jgi:hypothetical protein
MSAQRPSLCRSNAATPRRAPRASEEVGYRVVTEAIGKDIGGSLFALAAP